MEEKQTPVKEKKTIQNLLIISNILLWILTLKYIFFPLPCDNISSETTPIAIETPSVMVDTVVAANVPEAKAELPAVATPAKSEKIAEKPSEEDELWANAQDKKTLYSYNRYLKAFPQGKHKAAAEGKVVDIEVSQLMGQEHGKLPALDAEVPKGGVNPKTSLVKVKNDTEYELIVRYSGPESKRFSIPVGQEISFTTANGNYTVTATVNGGTRVKTYGGTEQLAGKNYFSEFYIKGKG